MLEQGKKTSGSPLKARVWGHILNCELLCCMGLMLSSGVKESGKALADTISRGLLSLPKTAQG
jgi:hypothetical protein